MKRLPGIPKATTAKARELVREFDRASRNVAWIGSGAPDDDPNAMAAYKAAKSNLLAFIADLERTVALRKIGGPT